MSDNHSSRAKLERLADALIEDIIAMPSEEIIAETDKNDIERARAILDAAKQQISKRLLMSAKTNFENWRTSQSKKEGSLKPAEIKIIFEKIRAGDEEFNRKVMLAARNGENPTDADIAGLVEDYFDLQQLDKRDEQK